MGEGQSQAQSCHAPRLGERLQNDQVLVALHRGEQRPLVGKVGISLVHNEHPVEPLRQFFQLEKRKSIARRIVWRAYPQQFRVLVAGRQQAFRRQREIIRVECHLSQCHIIRCRRHFIHAIRRRDGHGVVDAGAAENPKAEVDGFVTSVAHENLLNADSLYFRNQCLERFLVWVGVSVDTVLIRTLVGIEPNRNVAALIVVAGSGVGGEGQNIWPHIL